jgi:predicted transcriptional regulator
MTVICLGSIAAAGWTVYEGVSKRVTAIDKGCDGVPVGSVRIDKNGNPQICLKR